MTEMLDNHGKVATVYFAFDRGSATVLVKVDGMPTIRTGNDPSWHDVEEALDSSGASMAVEEGGEGGDGTDVMPMEQFKQHFKHRYF